eukprot:TRINITY_DN74893_c0_g1_i1.p1 TRINITY_DN74893_c0_g1~~TRINITY_DN74893_c0_g1_i1.p1  ORF type:complete len:161 (-),score=10.61 TRINITY_DN74893_c0_g1_i1:135-617(-)
MSGYPKTREEVEAWWQAEMKKLESNPGFQFTAKLKTMEDYAKLQMHADSFAEYKAEGWTLDSEIVSIGFDNKAKSFGLRNDKLHSTTNMEHMIEADKHMLAFVEANPERFEYLALCGYPAESVAMKKVRPVTEGFEAAAHTAKVALEDFVLELRRKAMAQ